ncbi:FAD/FMN-containing dehydrogenase [Kibdelosporangium banguiense]|uniref:FAD/FMN-containing dehydrogenase n=1 Tax=Kibdelosporangium banguiense TaxID=1365924 RepID=A0ABS4TPW8_9PSEU|nr:FAD-binding oxidoreductase [Kibdelosporangium banguiense]MBP2326451.1 FAD/FMN-containing dehydrogenase [Kibdelosporangium banguiense]
MNLGRRSFLRLAGISAAGVLATACSSEATPAPSSGVPSPSSAAPPPSGPPGWDTLRSNLKGRLLLPDDSDFATAKRVFNPLFDGRKPSAVARCTTPEDVEACVKAAAGRVPIAPRSGGHSYAGYSTPDGGLVVDITAMSKIDIQGDTVTIGAGARLKDVYAALGKAGRCLPAGTCPTVGIAGLTLGGGIGVLTRKYGLTCDHLVSAQVVTADGKLRTASADSEPDLFWALRGGGGGNFGIVTEFTFTTVPAPDVTVFELRFPASAANDVVNAWQRWVSSAPAELWTNLVLSGGSSVQCRVGGCYVGGESGLAKLLEAFITDTGATPTSRTARSMGYLAAMNHYAGSEKRQSFIGASRVITSPVDAAGLTSLMEGRTETDLLIDSMGGAVAGIGKQDTAFWHRDALATVQVYASATAANKDQVTQSVSEVVSQLAKAGATGAYVNYIDPTLPDWMTAYYGDNAVRLKKTAQTYDPDNVFGFGQGIQA